MQIVFFCRRFSFCYMFLLFSICSHAQQLKVDITDPVEFTPKSKVLKYGSSYISFEQSEVKNQPWTFKLYKEKFHIKLFKQDKSMKLVNEVAAANGKRVFGPFSPSLQKINKKLYFIYFYMPEESDESPIHIIAAEIDTLSLALLAPKEILTVNYKPTSGHFIVANTLTTDKLEIKSSPNNSTTLVTWCSGNNNQYFYSALDSNLTTIWFKKGTIESAKKIQLTGSCIDNNEVVYLGFRSIKKKELEEGHLIIGKRSTNDKDIILSVNEGKANEVNPIYSTLEGTVKVFGTYKTDSYNLYGVYATTVNTSNFTLNNLQLTPFPIDLLEQLKKEGWASTKDKSHGIFDCLDMEAYELQNGNIDMVGIFERTAYSTYQGHTIGSVFVAHFNNGKAIFCRLPKFEGNTTLFTASRYAVVISKNTTMIFYNELKKNLGEVNKHTYTTLSTNNIVFTMATITEGNIVKIEQVIGEQEDKLLAITDWITEIEPKVYLVPFQKVKTFGNLENLSRWATITVD